jgi:hypothetical protein
MFNGHTDCPGTLSGFGALNMHRSKEADMGRAAKKYNRLDRQAESVRDPDGNVVTLSDLPVAGESRWVPRRKAQVVAAVRGGLLSLDDACDRYALTVEEFLSWQTAMKKYGLAGLRATHAQEYRQAR